MTESECARQIRLLLIDDDADDHEVTRRLVRRIRSFRSEVRWEKTYEAGLAALRARICDICLLDYRLGARNGLELLAEARRGGCTVPVIFLTGQGERDTDDLAMKAGADDFLAKAELTAAALERSVRYALERAHNADELRGSEQLYRRIVETTVEGVWITDLEGRASFVNAQMAAMLGYAREKLVGRSISEFIDEYAYDAGKVNVLLRQRGPVQREVLFKRSGGGDLWAWVQTQPLLNAEGEHDANLIMVTDITERRRAETALRATEDFLAYHDALTGLPNRTLFQNRLVHALQVAARRDRLLAVHLIDIDHFKLVNDSLGHDVGDALLQEVATRLRRLLRKSDTVARLGGDEFAVLQPDIAKVDDAAVLGRKMVGGVREPFLVGAKELRPTASVGITIFPLDGTDACHLLKNADMAMYLAKRKDRNNFKFYTPSLSAELQARTAIIRDLQGALDRDEFVLHYQRQVDLRSGETVGVEALVRWRHHLRGLLLPAQFIHVAEDAGLSGRLGAWVLRAACAQNMAWQRAGLRPIRMAVNVSALQLAHKGFSAMVTDALARSGLSPKWLELEITESSLIQDHRAAELILRRLSKRGIRLALDDFGTGYSSLSYLNRLPIDRLKIDLSFVRGVDTDPTARAVAKTIIELGRALGQRVIAEGVETLQQAECLIAFGCDEAQGHFYARPLPAEDVAVALETDRWSASPMPSGVVPRPPSESTAPSERAESRR
jgi:diguanylate cyclase (GGDEF)-like protein/PAS domain S-box-containing protein